ncbi:MAG: prephenate dehydrogenase/arogenate dehydrogenase family protein [Chloracidobacterium sp.]|nr:prephenate dehydrogenase/arogenate dehydrogenase family protein [Chloracidobacterium sp.]
MSEFNHVCVVGCGLIGGSFALALRRAGFVGRITAYGGARSSRLAVERGIVDDLEESFERGEFCEADLIYLAAPIGGIIDFLRTSSERIRPGATVTDAGSTKIEICRVAAQSLPTSVTFIGGHPMAGGENTGVQYARADLFDQATYALMVGQGTGEAEFKRFKSLIESIGARVLLTLPESHDAAVALISHLPQLVASALASLLGPEREVENADSALARALAAAGWRDMTRLAGSSWSVWRDICLTNQPNISKALGALISELQSLKDALDSRDFNQARNLFAEANRSIAEQRALRYSRFEKYEMNSVSDLSSDR